MPSFRNLKDLEKYIIKTQGNKIKLSNNKTIMKIMQEEGNRLKDLIQKYIDEYYDSYTPTQYKRTYSFKNSLRIETVKQEGDILSVRIYFDESMAFYESLFGGEDGYVPRLIDEGWTWKDTTAGAYRLSNYEGFGFVDKAISEYEKDNPYGFKIEVMRS